MGGRDQSERLVAINRNQWSQSAGARRLPASSRAIARRPSLSDEKQTYLDHPLRIGSTEFMSLLRLLAALFLINCCAPACAEDADNALLAYAVSINQTAAKGRSGTGIYLGRGLVLTASHVVGEALIHRPQVTIAGLDLPARVSSRIPLSAPTLPYWRSTKTAFQQGYGFAASRFARHRLGRARTSLP